MSPRTGWKILAVQSHPTPLGRTPKRSNQDGCAPLFVGKHRGKWFNLAMLRSFFSYVPVSSGPPPEAPKVEAPDPHAALKLSDPFRAARRALVAFCAVCLAWATAQFSFKELKIDSLGITVDLKSASVPLLLGVGLIYLTARWVMEFAMMPREVRRWRLAQFDFRAVSLVSRISLLAITAGALDRSLRSVAAVVVLLFALAGVTSVLSVLLMFVTTPVRMWARSRAKRISAANAALEGIVWAGVFAVAFTVIGTIGLGMASYYYEPLRLAIWPLPPNPFALGIFLLTLNAIFLSYWLLRPPMKRLFAEPPPYYTERMDDGSLKVFHQSGTTVTYPARDSTPSAPQ